MMSDGIKKTAFAGTFQSARNIVARAGGFLSGKTQKLTHAISSGLRESKDTAAMVAGTEKRLAAGKRIPGSRAAEASIVKKENLNKAPLSDAEKNKIFADTRAEMKSRRKNFTPEIMRKEKPSFAKKHPLITAGLGYGALRMATGGGEEERRQPPVVYGGPGTY